MVCVALVIDHLWNSPSIIFSCFCLYSTTWDFHQIPQQVIMCQAFFSMLQLWYINIESVTSPIKQHSVHSPHIFTIFFVKLTHLYSYFCNLWLFATLHPNSSLNIWVHTLRHNPLSNLYTIQDIPVTYAPSSLWGNASWVASLLHCYFWWQAKDLLLYVFMAEAPHLWFNLMSSSGFCLQTWKDKS